MNETVQAGNPAPQANFAEETVFQELLRTSDQLTRELAPVLKAAEVSITQYNVLRILRGAREPVTCGEIAGRMITRDPYITRLLDRLEKRGLIERWRETRDRRVVQARITQQGLELLAKLDGPVQEAHRRRLGHLAPERRQALLELLRMVREGR